LQGLFVQDLDSVMAPDSGSYRVNADNRILALMNLPYINKYTDNAVADDMYFNLSTKEPSALNISGYQYAYRVTFDHYRETSTRKLQLVLGDSTVHVEWLKTSGVLKFRLADTELRFNIQEHIKKVFSTMKGEYYRTEIPAIDMVLSNQSGTFKVKLQLWTVTGEHLVEKDWFEINQLETELLIGF
jgi:hypothetical protein